MKNPALALRSRLRECGETALLFDTGGASRSGAEIVDATDALAGALQPLVPSHPRIGVWHRNGFAAIEAFLATEWLGGTRIPVDPSASAAEAEATFRAAAVDLVLCDGEHGGQLGMPALIHDDQARQRGTPQGPLPEVDPAAAHMVYPRGVVDGQLFGVTLSHGNWDAIIQLNISLYRSGSYGAWNESDECFVAAQQIMHATGFLTTFPALTMGIPQVLVAHFSADRVLAAMQERRATAIMLVPAMLKALTEAARARNEPSASLRHVLYGGGPVSLAEMLAAREWLGRGLSQVYGRLEGGWPLSVLGPADHDAIAGGDHRLATSCGRPVPAVEAQIRPLDPTDRSRGEIGVRTSMASTEYLDGDGWCSLGDIMRRDETGYLYFEGRLDRMINTGYHIYPDEVEAVIRSVPGVADSLVAGEPHDRWGQMLVAYVKPAPGTRADELSRALSDELPRRLAKYKVPKKIHLVDSIPGSGPRAAN
jgi:acyl-CoA synthetase (AMP-forming)/AMP-acid ligase II